MRPGEQVTFAQLATRSRRDRAVDNVRNLLDAFAPVPMPRGNLIGREQYVALVDKRDKTDSECAIWEENALLASERSGAEHENTSRLRGAFAAVCALREAESANPADAEARELGRLLRDYLAECWHVPAVPAGVSERDHLARSVVRGMMR